MNFHRHKPGFENLERKIFRLAKRFAVLAAALFCFFFLLDFFFPLPDKVAYSVVIRDASGEVVNAYLTPDDKWRMKTELNEISPLLRKTIIAKEDKYFYSHPGINPFAVCRAAFHNLLHMQRGSGASTITMQVARALEPRRRNVFTKLIETFRAFQLEWKYSKDEILQLYLNLVPYGSNVEGVKAASLLYFNKAPDHLSLAEITALSIIPNRPSSLVVGKRNDTIIKERNRWLKKFAADGVFTAQEIKDAEAEPLTAVRRTVPHYLPHFAYKLKKGNSGSINIRTNVVLNTQLKIEKLTEDYVRGLKLKGIRNAAVVVIDNKTHKVISYLGSAGFADTTDGGQVNGAAAVRQPGSTLKPLLYGLCIDEGLLTPKMMLNDVPVTYAGYAPENYDKEFHGAVTMEYALEHSLNVPAVRSLKQLGKEALMQKLVSAGFTQIRKDRAKLGLSVILGGCGASLEELTGLFSSFADGGVYYSPQYKAEDVSKRVQMVSPEAAYLITEALSKVNRPDFPLNWTATEHMPKIAWKTGTSYGRRDAWSIGYNKAFTVGVWCGNFSGAGMAELSGANTATPLLFRIFNSIDYDSDEDWYAPPKGLELRQVCSETGLPPGPNCTNLISDYFVPLVSSTRVCGHLQEVKVSPDSSVSYCEACAPPTGYVKKLYNVFDPELQDYFRATGTPYQIVPPHNRQCERIFKGEGPNVTFPVNGAEYFIDKKNPEPLQLTASVPADVSKIYWYINDRFYKAAGKGEKQFFVPEEGPVKIGCSDDKGRSKTVRINVRRVRL